MAIKKKDNLDYYQSLRKEFSKWIETKTGKNHKYAQYLMFAPDLFHLLCKLFAEPQVDKKDKAILAAAIAYFVAPIDIIPEALLGPAGYVDDIAIAAFALNRIINNSDSKIVTKHWAGEGDVLKIVKEIVKVADEMVGSGLWKQVKESVFGKEKKKTTSKKKK